MWDLTSPAKDRTHVLCIRSTESYLNHWTTREVPAFILYEQFPPLFHTFSHLSHPHLLNPLLKFIETLFCLYQNMRGVNQNSETEVKLSLVHSKSMTSSL